MDEFFRINPDFRISACQKVIFFFIFPIEIAEFEGFQDFQYILLATMQDENDACIDLYLSI